MRCVYVCACGENELIIIIAIECMCAAAHTYKQSRGYDDVCANLKAHLVYFY